MLSNYHHKYAARSDEDMAQRIRAKEHELRQVFERVPFAVASSPVRVAVLGCGERRFVTAHAKIFASILKAPVRVTTLDVTIEHLAGEPGVVQHDCTLPLPGGPYALAYSSVLLKFIPEEKRLDVLRNSVEALVPGGLAIHLFNPEDHAEDEIGRWLTSADERGWPHERFLVKTGPELKEDTVVLVFRAWR